MRMWMKMGRMPHMALPAAMPVRPFSAIGESITRSGPNSLASPTVEPNTPPGSSMPSPSR